MFCGQHANIEISVLPHNITTTACQKLSQNDHLVVRFGPGEVALMVYSLLYPWYLRMHSLTYCGLPGVIPYSEELR